MPIGSSLMRSFGSALGATSQNRAGRQARDFSIAQQALGAGNLNELLYGSGSREGILRTLVTMSPGMRERYLRERYGIHDDAMKETGRDLEDLTPEEMADYVVQQGGGQGGSGGPFGPGGYAGRRAGLGRFLEQGQEGVLRDFDADTTRLAGEGQRARGGLMDYFGRSEGVARQYGQGADALIDEEAERTLKGANRQGLAALSSRGFGNSTLVGNQIAANARNVGRDSREAKLGVRRDVTDRVLGVRGQGGAALSGFLGDEVARSYGRAGDRTRLQDLNLARTGDFRGTTLSQLLGAATSGAAGPYQADNPTAFYPGLSALGSGITTFGTDQQQDFYSMLEAAAAMFGGGGGGGGAMAMMG